MAHKLKEATDNEKGILVFTHKEWGFFSATKILRRLKREEKLPGIGYLDELRMPYMKVLQKLRAKYLIGVHFGFHYPHLFSSSVADFVLTRNSNLPSIASNLARIDFNSRDFIPKFFAKWEATDKTWDIMTVARDVKFKNFPLLFKSIRVMLEESPQTKFLLIVPSQQGVNWGVEKNLAKLFYDTFSRAQQENITLIYLHPTLEWGLSQTQLVDFYNRSKLFTLFSKEEGESRVVSEALCCGLPVVAYAGLKGGGTDMLNSQNSVLFEGYDTAHRAWQEALQKFPHGVKDQPWESTREDFTTVKLEQCFRDYYATQSMPFGQLDHISNLDRHLPAHYLDVPWYTDRKAPTADVLTKNQFSIFCASI